MVEQFELLPQTIASALPMSHRRLLSHVSDEDQRRRLVAQAVVAGWSKRDLAEEIRRDVPKSPRGRKPLPRFLKTLYALQKLVASPDEAFGDLEGRKLCIGPSVTSDRHQVGGRREVTACPIPADPNI